MQTTTTKADAAHWALPGSRVGRRAKIYGVAARVGARYARAAARARRHPQRAERFYAAAHRRGARDVHAVAVHLRGGFLKLGQFVSARPDLVPDAYVEQLTKLQDRVPPAPAAAIRRIVEADVGSLADHFADFDASSASAASLAQVHRATRLDGRPVAVKVQYPRVAEIVPAEARDTRRLLALADRFVKGVSLGTIAAALERTIVEEIDFAREADHVRRFARNFASEPSVLVPGVHDDLSAGRVLVLDWIDGENLARALRDADQAVAEEATRLLVDAYLKQILVDGFLHADPHPGNFLLQAGDGASPRLGIVDFGACAELSPDAQASLRQVYAAGLEMDLPGVIAGLDALGLRTASGDPASLLGWARLFSNDDTMEQQEREASWRELMAAARDDPVVHIPHELVMLGRVLIVQTGLVARVQPSWSFEEMIERRLAQEPAPRPEVAPGP